MTAEDGSVESEGKDFTSPVPIPSLAPRDSKKNQTTELLIDSYDGGSGSRPKAHSISSGKERCRLTSDVHQVPRNKDKLASNHIAWIQLSFWHPLFGPVTQQVWEVANRKQPDVRMSNDVYEYIARQTLQALSIVKKPGKPKTPPPKMMTEIHLVPEFGITVASEVFDVKTGRSKNDDDPMNPSVKSYALSMVLADHSTNRFLETLEAIEDELQILGMEVQAILDSQRLNSNTLGEEDACLLPIEREAVTNWTPVTQAFHRFSSRFDLLFESRISYPFELESTWFHRQMTPKQEEMLSHIITSHLQMIGSTVIVGPDQEEVKSLLYTLCLFSDPEQRALSRTAVFADPHDLAKHYFRQFSLQGIVTSSRNSEAMRGLKQAILLSRSPTSLIDLFAIQDNSDGPVVRHSRGQSSKLFGRALPFAAPQQGKRPRVRSRGIDVEKSILTTPKKHRSPTQSETGSGPRPASTRVAGLVLQTQLPDRYQARRRVLLRRRARDTAYQSTLVDPTLVGGAADTMSQGTSSTGTGRSSASAARRSTRFFLGPDSDASCIRDIVQTACALPTSLVLTYIETQFRLLQLKAAELLTFVEEGKADLLAWTDATERYSAKNFPSGDSVPRNLMYPEALKNFRDTVKNQLGIRDQEDFVVMLSLAERFRPNLYLTLYGNPILKNRMEAVLSLFL